MLSCVSPTSSYELPFILPVCYRNNIVALTIYMFSLHFNFSLLICFPVFQSFLSICPPSMYDRLPHLVPATVRSSIR
jgi:hypothetical protein